MALQLDKITELPAWKLAAIWAGVSLLLVGGWYSLYYSDAVDQRDQEKRTMASTLEERQEMEAKLAGFEKEMEKAALEQKEIDAAMEILPMSPAAVGHMMRSFQQQGRLVGVSFNQWSPQAEERKEYYATTAVKVKASGTWNQLGEFFRRLSELKKIVSIHDLALARQGSTKYSKAELSVSFTASTYRFLSDEERKHNDTQIKKSRRRRRKG